MKSSLIVLHVNPDERRNLADNGYVRRCRILSDKELFMEIWRKDDDNGIILASRRILKERMQASGMDFDTFFDAVWELERRALAVM